MFPYNFVKTNIRSRIQKIQDQTKKDKRTNERKKRRKLLQELLKEDDMINMNFTSIHKISNMHRNAFATQNEYQKQNTENPRSDKKRISAPMKEKKGGSFCKSF